MLTFVDTNVFVRLVVVADNDRQMMQAKKLFEQAQLGKLNLVIGPPVLFEVAWVLGRLYKMPQEEILNFLEAILSFPNLRILDKELVMEAIALVKKTGESFADCYIAVSAIHIEADNVAIFNKKHFANFGIGIYQL